MFALLFLLNLNLFAVSFEVRALWIVRDHIVSEKQINDIIEFAKINNYNHLFVQIRGRGDAYYNSRLVPRSHLLQKTEFDPLDYFIKQTKKSGIKIHAWMNVYYLWSATQMPSQRKHILLNHPGWLDTKEPDEMNVPLMLENMNKDRKINGEGFYLAPTHPEVEAHLQNVITELLQNYRLDGIHFDYIRYHDIGYGMNQTGLKFFLSYTSGIPGLPSMKIQKKPSFADYKRSAITSFVKKASQRIKAYQPDCIISAAVKPNLQNAKHTFGQEWDLWLTSGYIDWAVPMNYTKNNRIFDENLTIMQNSLPRKYINKIIMGIGAYNQKHRLAGQKIYKVGKNDFGGISIFSYTVFKKDPSYAKQIKKYLN
ncbi:MAG: glycoside hydrolase family 10 protein [Candidatus Neomarinimicrobiota bacterium]